MRVASPATVIIIALAGAAMGAPRPKDERKPTDPPGGDWVVQKREFDGRVQKGFTDQLSDFTIRFTSTRWVALRGKFQYALAERIECHKNGGTFEIDVLASDRRGIWTVDGDTLLVCLGAVGADRPNEFSAPKGSRRILWTLTRKGKE